MQRKKRAEERGKGTFATLLERKPKGGGSPRSLLVGKYGFVPLISAVVVSQPEGPTRIPPSMQGLVGGKLHPPLVTEVTISGKFEILHKDSACTALSLL